MNKFQQSDADVVMVIGSGAGGGTMAHELTRRGLKVVLFEAGRDFRRADLKQGPPA